MDIYSILLGFFILGIALIIASKYLTKANRKRLSDLEEIVNDCSEKKEVLYAYETLLNEWDNLEGYELELLRMKGVLLDKLIKFV